MGGCDEGPAPDGLRDLEEVMAARRQERATGEPFPSPAPVVDEGRAEATAPVRSDVEEGTAHAPSPVEAALAYLASTHDRIPAEALIGVELYAEVHQSAVPTALVERLRANLDVLDPANVGAHLRERVPAAAILPAPVPRVRPDPELATRCTAAGFTCRLGERCLEYLATPVEGIESLTQAYALTLLQWRACSRGAELVAGRGAEVHALLEDARSASLAAPAGVVDQARRLALLFELGAGERVDDAWVTALAASQARDGGFPDTQGAARSSARATGAMLWLWARRERAAGVHELTGEELLFQHLGIEGDPPTDPQREEAAPPQ